MLSKVSWSVYVGVVVILLIIYYAFVGIKYYHKEIKSLLSGKLPKKAGTAKKENLPQKDALSDASFDELEMTVNDIRYAILDRAGKQADKAELISQLKQRLANYTGLRKPAYRVAINNYIITNAKEICGVAFDADELNAAWDSLL